MRDVDHDAAPAADLRQRAEALHLERSTHPPRGVQALSPEATQHLLHELAVHQIELEMQNDELRRAQGEIESARARLFDLYDLAPVGYCTLDENGLIAQANLVAATLLGLARGALIGQPLTRFIAREDQDTFYRQHKELAQTGRTSARDLRMVRSGGHGFWAQLAVSRTLADGGAPELRVVLIDATERKRAEAALQHSVAFNLAVIDSLPAHIAVLDARGFIVAVNAAWRQFARDNGAPDASVVAVGANYLEVCARCINRPAGADATLALAGIQAVLTGERRGFQFEYPCHAPGVERWFRMGVTPLVSASGGVVVSHERVTERTLAKVAL